MVQKILGSPRPKILKLIPAEVKNAESLGVSNSAIKVWKPKECLCRLM